MSFRMPLGVSVCVVKVQQSAALSVTSQQMNVLPFDSPETHLSSIMEAQLVYRSQGSGQITHQMLTFHREEAQEEWHFPICQLAGCGCKVVKSLMQMKAKIVLSVKWNIWNAACFSLFSVRALNVKLHDFSSSLIAILYYILLYTLYAKIILSGIYLFSSSGLWMKCYFMKWNKYRRWINKEHKRKF